MGYGRWWYVLGIIVATGYMVTVTISLISRPNQCSLTEHNVYTYEVEVAGPYGERVVSVLEFSFILASTEICARLCRTIVIGHKNTNGTPTQYQFYMLIMGFGYICFRRLRVH